MRSMATVSNNDNSSLDQTKGVSMNSDDDKKIEGIVNVVQSKGNNEEEDILQEEDNEDFEDQAESSLGTPHMMGAFIESSFVSLESIDTIDTAALVGIILDSSQIDNEADRELAVREALSMKIGTDESKYRKKETSIPDINSNLRTDSDNALIEDLLATSKIRDSVDRGASINNVLALKKQRDSLRDHTLIDASTDKKNIDIPISESAVGIPTDITILTMSEKEERKDSLEIQNEEPINKELIVGIPDDLVTIIPVIDIAATDISTEGVSEISPGIPVIDIPFNLPVTDMLIKEPVTDILSKLPDTEMVVIKPGSEQITSVSLIDSSIELFQTDEEVSQLITEDSLTGYIDSDSIGVNTKDSAPADVDVKSVVYGGISEEVGNDAVNDRVEDTENFEVLNDFNMDLLSDNNIESHSMPPVLAQELDEDSISEAARIDVDETPIKQNNNCEDMPDILGEIITDIDKDILAQSTGTVEGVNIISGVFDVTQEVINDNNVQDTTSSDVANEAVVVDVNVEPILVDSILLANAEIDGGLSLDDGNVINLTVVDNSLEGHIDDGSTEGVLDRSSNDIHSDFEGFINIDAVNNKVEYVENVEVLNDGNIGRNIECEVEDYSMPPAMLQEPDANDVSEAAEISGVDTRINCNDVVEVLVDGFSKVVNGVDGDIVTQRSGAVEDSTQETINDDYVLQVTTSSDMAKEEEAVAVVADNDDHYVEPVLVDSIIVVNEEVDEGHDDDKVGDIECIDDSPKAHLESGNMESYIEDSSIEVDNIVGGGIHNESRIDAESDGIKDFENIAVANDVTTESNFVESFVNHSTPPAVVKKLDEDGISVATQIDAVETPIKEVDDGKVVADDLSKTVNDVSEDIVTQSAGIEEGVNIMNGVFDAPQEITNGDYFQVATNPDLAKEAVVADFDIEPVLVDSILVANDKIDKGLDDDKDKYIEVIDNSSTKLNVEDSSVEVDSIVNVGIHDDFKIDADNDGEENVGNVEVANDINIVSNLDSNIDSHLIPPAVASELDADSSSEVVNIDVVELPILKEGERVGEVLAHDLSEIVNDVDVGGDIAAQSAGTEEGQDVENRVVDATQETINDDYVLQVTTSSDMAKEEEAVAVVADNDDHYVEPVLVDSIIVVNEEVDEGHDDDKVGDIECIDDYLQDYVDSSSEKVVIEDSSADVNSGDAEGRTGIHNDIVNNAVDDRIKIVEIVEVVNDVNSGISNIDGDIENRSLLPIVDTQLDIDGMNEGVEPLVNYDADEVVAVDLGKGASYIDGENVEKSAGAVNRIYVKSGEEDQNQETINDDSVQVTASPDVPDEADVVVADGDVDDNHIEEYVIIQESTSDLMAKTLAIEFVGGILDLNPYFIRADNLKDGDDSSLGLGTAIQEVTEGDDIILSTKECNFDVDVDVAFSRTPSEMTDSASEGREEVLAVNHSPPSFEGSEAVDSNDCDISTSKEEEQVLASDPFSDDNVIDSIKSVVRSISGKVSKGNSHRFESFSVPEAQWDQEAPNPNPNFDVPSSGRLKSTDEGDVEENEGEGGDNRKDDNNNCLGDIQNETDKTSNIDADVDVAFSRTPSEMTDSASEGRGEVLAVNPSPPSFEGSEAVDSNDCDISTSKGEEQVLASDPSSEDKAVVSIESFIRTISGNVSKGNSHSVPEAQWDQEAPNLNPNFDVPSSGRLKSTDEGDVEENEGEGDTGDSAQNSEDNEHVHTTLYDPVLDELEYIRKISIEKLEKDESEKVDLSQKNDGSEVATDNGITILGNDANLRDSSIVDSVTSLLSSYYEEELVCSSIKLLDGNTIVADDEHEEEEDAPSGYREETYEEESYEEELIVLPLPFSSENSSRRSSVEENVDLEVDHPTAIIIDYATMATGIYNDVPTEVYEDDEKDSYVAQNDDNNIRDDRGSLRDQYQYGYLDRDSEVRPRSEGMIQKLQDGRSLSQGEGEAFIPSHSHLMSSTNPKKYKQHTHKKVVLPYQRISIDRKKNIKMLKLQQQLQLEELSSQSSEIYFPRFLSPVELVRVLQSQSLPINRNLTTSALNVDNDKIKPPLSPLSYWSPTKSSGYWAKDKISRMESKSAGKPLPCMKSTINTLQSLPSIYHLPTDSISLQHPPRSHSHSGKSNPTGSLSLASSPAACPRRRGYSPMTSRSELDSPVSVYDQLLPVTERMESIDSARMVMLMSPLKKSNLASIIDEEPSILGLRQQGGKIKMIPNYSMRSPLSNNSEFIRIDEKHLKKSKIKEDFSY